MYQDMTARDLLQQRYTLPNGDTEWRLSPLVQAALEGGLAVLDGLNRVNPGTLSVLQRLVSFDGNCRQKFVRGRKLCRNQNMSGASGKHRVPLIVMTSSCKNATSLFSMAFRWQAGARPRNHSS